MADRMVVVDVDGTLTRSDVRGYVETVYLGMYDYVHSGVADFLNSIVSASVSFISIAFSTSFHHYTSLFRYTTLLWYLINNVLLFLGETRHDDDRVR